MRVGIVHHAPFDLHPEQPAQTTYDVVGARQQMQRVSRSPHLI